MENYSTSLMKLFSPSELSVLSKVFKSFHTPEAILTRLNIRPPKEEKDQYQKIKEYFTEYGLEQFQAVIYNEPETDRGAEQHGQNKTRVSTILPKIKIDDDGTQPLRSSYKREPKVRERVDYDSKHGITRRSVTPLEAHRKIEESSHTVSTQTHDTNTVEVKENSKKIKTYPRDEDGYLGDPTADWDGITERRSGLDRRQNKERRNRCEVVFANQRFGKDRRSGKDRRKK